MSEQPEPIRVVQVVWLSEDKVAVQHSPGVKFEHFAIASAVILRAGNRLQDQVDAAPPEALHPVKVDA